MRPNFLFLLTASKANFKPGGTLKWKKRLVKGKAFAAAHRSNVDSQAYIFASRHVLSVIAKANSEEWKATCSSLSLKSNHKSVYSLLCSIAGSFFSSSSSSPNFSNYSFLRYQSHVPGGITFLFLLLLLPR